MMAFTLPLFPSAQARRSLTASQLVRLNESIALALQSVLDIPISKIDPTSARAFVSSYTKEAAQETLDGLLWQPTGAGPSTHAKLIRSRSLELARRLAGLPGGLSLETLTDMSIAYAQKNVSRVRDIWSSALKTHPALRTAVAADMVPSFSSLLDLNSISGVGLYGIRKTAHCVSCTVHSVPPEIISTFAKNKEFMVSLAKAYDAGLLALSRTYGGLQHLSSSSSKPEEWETIWMESKTALLDSFHVLIRHILEAVGSAQPGGALAFEADHAFEVVFGILEAASSTDRDPTVQRVPFYNQSLLADYQHAYDMKKTLGTALRRADAARMDLLDSQLRSLNGFGDSSKDPGALKLLIRSDGISSSAAGRSSARPQERAIASATAASASSSSQPMSADPNVESQVAQVRELLPDYSETYIRALLVHPDYPYCGNPERVIEALLEGTAPPSNEIEPTVPQNAAIQPVPVERWAYTAERRNVFDDEQVDMSNLRTGKKAEPVALQQDREAIERMKADILRRVEAMDEEDALSEVSDSELGITRNKARDIAYEEELDEEGPVRVTGDGSAESEVDDDETDREDAKPTPETVLELAYIRDSKLFERDAQTRRAKARTELKQQTGWADEQIEGWKIMFERMPQSQRDRILLKHEFKGNRPAAPSAGATDDERDGPGGGGRGRGHRGGGGGGRGRGGGGGGRGRGGRGRGGGGGDGGERVWKDKNKASQGNHNRKRGHDKKMARSGPAPSI